MDIKLIFVTFLCAAFGFIIVMFTIGFDIYQNLEIALLILGLLSTFGGAYLGAKVAGESNAKISKEERAIIIGRQKKRGEFIKTEFVKECDEIIKRFRYKDIVARLNGIPVTSVFSDYEYERVDNDYIIRVRQMAQILNEYRTSESFYYLDDNDIEHINSIAKTINDIYAKLLYLNEMLDEGTPQSDEDFKKKVNELGKVILHYYSLTRE